ncbi:MAG: DUF1003 domain-containing protein [Vallitaleaceae bacterium]|nr:DUF1003 domain-containing protein [Vallitaleaceae bacterium]
MKKEQLAVKRCGICNEEKSVDNLTPTTDVFKPLAEMMTKEQPDWLQAGYVCSKDLNHYRDRYIHELLRKEHWDTNQLELEIKGILSDDQRKRERLKEVDPPLTRGQKLADQVAKFGGSWKFIVSFATIIVLWVSINAFELFLHPFDPYPFILLNLILSCVASLQAPVIMMSQNRQEKKDREHLENDLQVNLQAELEVRMMQLKMDHLANEWIHLLEIQTMQFELLQHISHKLE